MSKTPEQIKTAYAEMLAKEIAASSFFNISEMKERIAMYMSLAFDDLTSLFSNKYEPEYAKALELQAGYRLGSSQYIKQGYKLAELRNKKTTYNRMLNEQRSCKLKAMKEFIVKNHGEDKLNEIFESVKTETV